MTSPYRVFIAADVIAALRECSRLEKLTITNLFDNLSLNPFRAGDYVEPDEVGRPVQVMVVGNRAVYFWADHAIKEVKVTDLKFAGR